MLFRSEHVFLDELACAEWIMKAGTRKLSLKGISIYRAKPFVNNSNMENRALCYAQLSATTKKEKSRYPTEIAQTL